MNINTHYQPESGFESVTLLKRRSTCAGDSFEIQGDLAYKNIIRHKYILVLQLIPELLQSYSGFRAVVPT